ncbi:MAG: DUF6273 domain-containing protein [Clostridia bacterium]|nr:DUF6273 domain-containing protein [Clostridia bacterium]
MKKIKYLGLILLLVLFSLVFAACGSDVIDGIINDLNKLPISVEITGLEGVNGTAQVELLSETELKNALDIVKKDFYIAEGETVYAVDISIKDESGEDVKIDNPVTVTITVNDTKLPLDKLTVFHVHNNTAEEIVPRVADGKLVVSVTSFSPFLVVPKHEHSFGEWKVYSEASGCGEMGLERRTCACGEFEERDYEKRHELTHVDKVDATCTKAGTKEYWTCSECEKMFTDETTSTELTKNDVIIPALGHVDKNSDKKCDRCGETLGKDGQEGDDSGKVDPKDDDTKPKDDETDPKEDENLITEDEVITTYKRVGNDIYFGYYPQTLVTDETLLAQLNQTYTDLPGRTEDQFNGWTSYEYYVGENANGSAQKANIMFYFDTEYNNAKYRAVYMLQYRSDNPDYAVGYQPSSSDKWSRTRQENTGYQRCVVYWFKYEPIKWRILEERKDGKALLIADIVLDSQAFLDIVEFIGYNDKSNSMYRNTNPGVPENTYVNNYEYSSIRAWLNDTFYNTAFTQLQKQLIVLTNVDNGVNSSHATEVYINGTSEYNVGTEFLCNNTNDYIFLPSLADMGNSDYGFDVINNSDQARRRKFSDYACSQGLFVYNNQYTGYEDFACYWLRTAREDPENDSYALFVQEGGGLRISGVTSGIGRTNDNSCGVCPMLYITLAE